jgi:hypothetical protein
MTCPSDYEVANIFNLSPICRQSRALICRMDKKSSESDKIVTSHIVRIYRLDKTRRGEVLGVVETVGEHVKTAFTNVDELWNILESKQKGGSNIRFSNSGV